MKRVLATICCVALCSVPVLAQHKAKHGTMKTAMKAAMTDQQFVNFAAQTDMVEANLGQLAQNNAATQPIKDYAQTLVTDHTNDYNQLYAAAHQANLDVPNAIDAENNKAMIDPFEKLTGKAFDRRYVRDMVAGHTKAIAVYKKEVAEAQNPSLKTYAEQALPILEKHLDGAKDLEKAPARHK